MAELCCIRKAVDHGGLWLDRPAALAALVAAPAAQPHTDRAAAAGPIPPAVASFSQSRVRAGLEICLAHIPGQRVDHRPGLVTVAGEDVALPHLVGPLPAGQRRLSEGHVADPPHLLGQRLEQHPPLLQLADDRLLPLETDPSRSAIVGPDRALG